MNTTAVRKSIVACFDSFKDCLSAQEIGSIVLNSLAKHSPYIHQETLAADHHSNHHKLAFDLVNVPLSDGGEGFLHAFQQTHSENEYEMRSHRVGHVMESRRLRGETVDAQYMLLKKNEGLDGGASEVAVVESAKCVGIELVPVVERNPMHTSTFALGELIKHIVFEQKIRHLRVGLGGSATSDGGLGLLQALGVRLWCLNEQTNERFEPDVFYGRHLPMLVDFDASEMIQSLPDDIRMELACDVTNPFLGPLGAVHVFSKQKGAVEQTMRDMLESGMHKLNSLYQEKFGIDLSLVAGSGAAGGISGSLYAVLRQKNTEAVAMRKGIEIIADSANLREKIARAELVLTGEGSFDGQSSAGKVVSLVQEIAYEHNVPLVIICGQSHVNDLGEFSHNTKVLPLVPDQFSFEESMKNTRNCLDLLVQRNVHQFRFKPYHTVYNLSFSTPRRYRIDLETKPEERWAPIIKDYLPQLHVFKNYLMDNMRIEFGSVKLASAMQSIAGWASKNIYTPSEIVRELKGIAAITQQACGLNYDDLLTLNMGYNWLAHCTSAVCLDHSTDHPPYHFRNMDWDLELSRELRNMTIDVEFYQNNKPLYIMTTWVCFIGATTGMRYSEEMSTDYPKGYSISINYRKTDESAGIMKNFVSGVCSYWPIEMLLRTVLSQEDTFSRALYKLSKENVMAPCYLTICGSTNNEGVILTRGRHRDEKRLQIHPERTPFIVQTNIDHWMKEVDRVWAGTDMLLHSAIDRKIAATNYLTSGRLSSIENHYDQSEFAVRVGFCFVAK